MTTCLLNGSTNLQYGTNMCIGKGHWQTSKACGIAYKTCLQIDISRLSAASQFLSSKRHGSLHACLYRSKASKPTVTMSCMQDSAMKYFDFVVVGSGVAGLRYALEVSKHGSVAIITKAEPQESNTNYAQGGVSAVLCPSDSVENHMRDTIVAGAYLCDEETVRVVCTEGPDRVKELIAIGASFDHGDDGKLHLAREGGHSHHRIVHAADMTGREIERALLKAVDDDPNIFMFGHHFAIDLLTSQDNEGIYCHGVDALNTEIQQVVRFLSKVTLLASGGVGHIYPTTTNPPVATGDGIAMAHRAQAVISNMENKCAACYRQYNKMEHLVEHMRVSFHSVHEPKCGVCQKHCRSFESIREHLIGTLPKIECSKVFSVRGCNLCLNIFDSQTALRYHRGSCQMSRAALINCMSRLGLQSSLEFDVRAQGARVVALGCKMVGGGSDGTLDLCARVCLIDQDENIIFHTYLKPQIPVTNYRYETTGIRPDHLREAMPLKQAQRKIQDFLCNGEAIWKLRSRGGRARILVGHGLGHDFDCLGIEYPSFLIRDTANYPPLMKTSKLSNSLKYLTQAYLGYEIQNGIQDPYEDCVAAMRLYVRVRSPDHPRDCSSGSGEAQARNNFASWRQRELERMTPEALLEISACHSFSVTSGYDIVWQTRRIV